MTRPTPERIQLWGGSLCFDFANTVDWDRAERPTERRHTDVLGSPEMLVRWAQRVGVLSSSAPPRPSSVELERALVLRRALHRLFSAVAAGHEPAAAELKVLTGTAAEALAAGQLASRDQAWHWSWPPDEPRRLRFAVATDAISVLGDPVSAGRVTRCPGENCGWLFLNSSGRRRWCSMSTCGSRAKMRRQYARNRTS